MCISCLGFALLIWLPGLLHAQSSEQPCPAPLLDGGYFVPQEKQFPHGGVLTYSCDSGLKPAVEGWWATSTCQHGKWSHEPQCISEKACFPPTIPNRNITANSDGWYEDQSQFKVTCNKGYEVNGMSAVHCSNSKWSSLPVCNKSSDACSEPPKIDHATIISEGYQEVFANNTEVLYECDKGYTTDGTNNKGSIRCSSGNWTEGPACETHCVMNPAKYPHVDLRHKTKKETASEHQYTALQCTQSGYYAYLQCNKGKIILTQCCNRHNIQECYDFIQQSRGATAA